MHKTTLGAPNGVSDRPKPPLVVTWCSAVKRRPPKVTAAALEPGPQEAVATAWRKALAGAVPDDEAKDIYSGRGFALARDAAASVGADLTVVSAGLGWVPARTIIVAYDLTSSRGGLAEKIVGPFDRATWWSSIVQGRFSTAPSIDLMDRPLVLVCMSQTYAPFMVAALADVPPELLRVFGCGVAGMLPQFLRPSVMPYDDRLASIGINGTRSDFAQRALSHYVANLANGGTIAEDRAAVLAALSGAEPPVAWPKRRAVGDDAIRVLIRKMLPVLGAKRTLMLRHLRDDEGVACEQGRFARLFVETVRSL